MSATTRCSPAARESKTVPPPAAAGNIPVAGVYVASRRAGVVPRFVSVSSEVKRTAPPTPITSRTTGTRSSARAVPWGAPRRAARAAGASSRFRVTPFLGSVTGVPVERIAAITSEGRRAGSAPKRSAATPEAYGAAPDVPPKQPIVPPPLRGASAQCEGARTSRRSPESA